MSGFVEFLKDDPSTSGVIARVRFTKLYAMLGMKAKWATE